MSQCNTNDALEVTVLMPCLNEEETIGACIAKAQTSIEAHGIVAEVLIADNGSTDTSVEVALSMGARVIHVLENGYGSALSAGIKEAKGRFVIMGDSDNSYDFGDLYKFIEMLRKGYDLVMGNRFGGGIEKGAMPFLHKYVGNPVLSFIGRLFFKSPIKDFHCGLRGFNRKAILNIGLCTTGMEFASEMVVKSVLNQMKIAEVPIKLYPDGRSRAPHLRTWRDGWRHLRFLLLYCPKWLFLYPGFLIVLIGLTVSTILFFGPVTVANITFDIHTMLYFSTMVLIGFQAIAFYYQSHVFAIRMKLLKKKDWLERFQIWFSLERGLFAGSLILITGVVMTIGSFLVWNKNAFGDLDPAQVFRFVIPSVVCLVLGVQILFNSFFISLLTLKTK